MKYFLTATINRANGKRHIVTTSDDLAYLKSRLQMMERKGYVFAIYDSKWRLIEQRRG